MGLCRGPSACMKGNAMRRHHPLLIRAASPASGAAALDLIGHVFNNVQEPAPIVRPILNFLQELAQPKKFRLAFHVLIPKQSDDCVRKGFYDHLPGFPIVHQSLRQGEKLNAQALNIGVFGRPQRCGWTFLVCVLHRAPSFSYTSTVARWIPARKRKAKTPEVTALLIRATPATSTTALDCIRHVVNEFQIFAPLAKARLKFAQKVPRPDEFFVPLRIFLFDQADDRASKTASRRAQGHAFIHQLLRQPKKLNFSTPRFRIADQFHQCGRQFVLLCHCHSSFYFPSTVTRRNAMCIKKSLMKHAAATFASDAFIQNLAVPFFGIVQSLMLNGKILPDSFKKLHCPMLSAFTAFALAGNELHNHLHHRLRDQTRAIPCHTTLPQQPKQLRFYVLNLGPVVPILRLRQWVFVIEIAFTGPPSDFPHVLPPSVERLGIALHKVMLPTRGFIGLFIFTLKQIEHHEDKRVQDRVAMFALFQHSGDQGSKRIHDRFIVRIIRKQPC
ncbi:hypothetical protein NH44784_017591 [Achromobacter xylosoxidans NH44784-1996]|nr:hypothetical protein NH44784_017591 [Achromobacter xylosoxidans NH44784-1996]